MAGCRPRRRCSGSTCDARVLAAASALLAASRASATWRTVAWSASPSGAAQPKAADWKYLYLDFAREGEIAHVISEYAYSGVQIHFCKATVTDSESGQR